MTQERSSLERSGDGSRFRVAITDASRYWEPRRLIYNVVLAVIVMAYFAVNWPHSAAAVSVDGLLVLFLLAVLANVCYCAAYLGDIFVQVSGFQDTWRRWRWVLFLVGIIFVGGRRSGLLALGDEVTWRASHFGVGQTLTSRITAWERPAHFRDSMVQGAFARLEHDHRFTDDGGGRTIMRETLEYGAPLGLLGRAVEGLVLTRYLRRFLEARNREIKALAESGAWREFLPGD
jgi:ligand-binding SRPBCC domain-containing protein